MARRRTESRFSTPEREPSRRTGACSRRRTSAAGTTLGARVLVLGGGTTAPSGSTQIQTGERTTTGGALPGARADAGAVTIGRTAYVVGGYDGPAMDSEVLATTDGRRYRAVTALPVPVRYPALAALGSRIYVFGGLGANGRPSGAVQLVDPAGRTARVVGRLPRPLDSAATGVLGGTIYLAGGRTAAGPTAAIYAFQPHGASFLRAGSLRVPVANAGATVSDGRLWLVGGETRGDRPTAAVQMVVANEGFGRAGDPGAGSPFAGDKLLIADRGNNRLSSSTTASTSLDVTRRAAQPAAAGGFYFPDDAFFIHHGTGDHLQPGGEPHDRRDRLPVGTDRSGPTGTPAGRHRTRVPARARRRLPAAATATVTVADAKTAASCSSAPQARPCAPDRHDGRCVHDPPDLARLPNGDTPLAERQRPRLRDQRLLDRRVHPAGRLVWTRAAADRLPLRPAAARPRPLPGRRLRPPRRRSSSSTARGQILWSLPRRQPGHGMLDHPCLAERLPNGLICVNDDYRHRVVVIDPTTGHDRLAVRRRRRLRAPPRACSTPPTASTSSRPAAPHRRTPTTG